MHTIQISIASSAMTTTAPPPPAPAITAIGNIIASFGVEVLSVAIKNTRFVSIGPDKGETIPV